MENRELPIEQNSPVIENQNENLLHTAEAVQLLQKEDDGTDMIEAKNIEIKKKILNEEKIAEIRESLGLSEKEPLSLLEGIDASCFDIEQLNIVKGFYKNRETRANIINPDLHLRNIDRFSTKIGNFTRELRGKPEFIKNIDSKREDGNETIGDCSMDYLDVQYEVSPVIDTVEKSIREIASSMTPEQKELKLLIEKKDVHYFIKKVFVDNINVVSEDVPFEENTLWQALKNAKFEINLNKKSDDITRDGGGGGETVGLWAKVDGSLNDIDSALDTFSSLLTHEYTHVHQTAVDPKMWDGSDFAGRTYAGHASHPTEMQARVNEAVDFSRKHNTSFDISLLSVIDNYVKQGEEKIKKEGVKVEDFKNEMISLHREFFYKKYTNIKNLYNL